MEERKSAFSLENLTQYIKRRTLIAVCLACFVGFSLLTASHLLDFPSAKVAQQPSVPARPSSPKADDKIKAQTSFNGKWDFKRDRKNLVLSQSQCDKAFPDLFYEIERAVKDRNGKPITKKEIDGIKPRNGYVRGMIYDNQLYVIQTEGKIYSRGLAILLSINRALTTSPAPLPNIEFTFSSDDWLPPLPQWALARKGSDKETWLMPDFGYWSWPETKVGSYGEVQEKALEMESTANNPTGKAWKWANKIPKLLWRGAIMGLELREKLLKVSEGKDWADIKTIDWHNDESMKGDLKSMAEHCQYKYLVNTAGNSYSGRLKYIQNCRSVIIMHEMTWLQHHTHLMVKDGEKQNYVEVQRDFGDLDKTMQALQKDDQKARKIADNNVRTFRERYLTPAAEVCYWRRLIQRWADISFEPEFYKEVDGKKVWRGLPIESYALERRLEWDPY